MHFLPQFRSTLVCRRVLASLSALLLSTAIAQQAAPLAASAKPAQSEAMTAPATNTTAVVLVREPTGSIVSMADLVSELRRVPTIERKVILSKPEKLRQIVSNLLVRRMLASEAERDGLGVDPVVTATLAISRDRVLSDARLLQLDAQNTPSEAGLDAYARNVYQANPTRFEKKAQTRARHILLASSGPESLQKATDLLAQLRAGASFEELAKTYSTDQSSAVRGGDLGFFEAGKMVQPFEEALNKLAKPGDLSEPVASQFGYHLIRLEERREKGQQPYSEVRDQLLAEARASILNEVRVQKVQAISKDFVFEADAIEAMAEPSTR